MSDCRKVAIQGIGGSFHHQVAEQYFGNNIDLAECMSFVEIPDLVNNRIVDDAVMAIENSLAGAILPNYALIDDNNLLIEGEVYLPIQHHLMGLAGQELADIKEVRSHPMAILQCQKFFRNHPNIKLVEASDTAAVAKEISDMNIKGVAAIASRKAAELYGLNIIEDRIQTREQNYTRFFILKKRNGVSNSDPSVNKASLKFITKHEKGSLAKVLQIFAEHDINLTKIQSIPLIDDPWEYAFFADIIFDNYFDYTKALDHVKSNGNQVKILGEYVMSKRKPRLNS